METRAETEGPPQPLPRAGGPPALADGSTVTAGWTGRDVVLVEGAVAAGPHGFLYRGWHCGRAEPVTLLEYCPDWLPKRPGDLRRDAALTAARDHYLGMANRLQRAFGERALRRREDDTLFIVLAADVPVMAALALLNPAQATQETGQDLAPRSRRELPRWVAWAVVLPGLAAFLLDPFSWLPALAIGFGRLVEGFDRRGMWHDLGFRARVLGGICLMALVADMVVGTLAQTALGPPLPPPVPFAGSPTPAQIQPLSLVPAPPAAPVCAPADLALDVVPRDVVVHVAPWELRIALERGAALIESTPLMPASFGCLAAVWLGLDAGAVWPALARSIPGAAIPLLMIVPCLLVLMALPLRALRRQEPVLLEAQRVTADQRLRLGVALGLVLGLQAVLVWLVLSAGSVTLALAVGLPGLMFLGFASGMVVRLIDRSGRLGGFGMAAILLALALLVWFILVVPLRLGRPLLADRFLASLFVGLDGALAALGFLTLCGLIVTFMITLLFDLTDSWAARRARIGGRAVGRGLA